MLEEIKGAIVAVNRGNEREKVDNTDVSAVILFLNGMDKETAFYLTKASGHISDAIIKQRAKAFFESDKITGLMDAVRPIVSSEERRKEVGIGSWENMDVTSLSPVELEKMGTVLLRDASMRSDVDTKEINDLIKMLDAIGALPKKEKEEKDRKQVIIKPLYNTVCEHCGKETYINPASQEEKHCSKETYINAEDAMDKETDVTQKK